MAVLVAALLARRMTSSLLTIRYERRSGTDSAISPSAQIYLHRARFSKPPNHHVNTLKLDLELQRLKE